MAGEFNESILLLDGDGDGIALVGTFKDRGDPKLTAGEAVDGTREAEVGPYPSLP